MASNLIIVDSCVLIKAFRNDANAIKDLKVIYGHTAYSVITQTKKISILLKESIFINNANDWLSRKRYVYLGIESKFKFGIVIHQ